MDIHKSWCHLQSRPAVVPLQVCCNTLTLSLTPSHTRKDNNTVNMQTFPPTCTVLSHLVPPNVAPSTPLNATESSADLRWTRDLRHADRLLLSGTIAASRTDAGTMASSSMSSPPTRTHTLTHTHAHRYLRRLLLQPQRGGAAREEGGRGGGDPEPRDLDHASTATARSANPHRNAPVPLAGVATPPAVCQQNWEGSVTVSPDETHR